MSYSEAITRTDLTNILNEVLPVSYSLSSVKTVTLPFTPTSNGLLIGMIRATAQGRAYVSLNNTTPDLMDGFNDTQGYYGATVFAEKGKQISVASTYNVMQQLYYFVSLGNDALTDYVVEQGTSGIWTYRKWNSGVAECWLSELNVGSKAMTTQEGSGYYAAAQAYYFPTDFFIATPSIQVSGDLQGALGGCVIASADKTLFNGYWWATHSITKTCYLNVYAKGKWK